jgi:hypothetical protein
MDWQPDHFIRGLSTRIWLPERADVLISEVIGNEPLAERVIGITQDALRRLLKPGARLIPSGIRIFTLPVTIPGAELAKLHSREGTLQKWRSWYDIQVTPLTRIAEYLPFESRFSSLSTPIRCVTGKFSALGATRERGLQDVEGPLDPYEQDGHCDRVRSLRWPGRVFRTAGWFEHFIDTPAGCG